MTDRELDDILREALVLLNTPEYLELPDEPYPTSEIHEKKMALLRADPDAYLKKLRRAARPLWRKVLSTAAAVVLALSVSLAGVMAVSPTARAWVERVVVQWLEEYVGFRFHGEEAKENGIWRPSYLPMGFQEVDSLDNTVLGYGYVLYEDETGLYLSYSCGLCSRISHGIKDKAVSVKADITYRSVVSNVKLTPKRDEKVRT